MQADDPFNLARFVAAQAPVFETVLDELSEGRKRTHWMWFVFPQLRGLGHSSTAHFYGIASLEEARAFLADALLGPRLVLCTKHVLAVERRSLREIFGSPDDMKFCSSISLFALAESAEASVFHHALERYCGGRTDAATLAILQTEK